MSQQDNVIHITELAARPHEAATARYEEILTFCANHLRPGVHYGKVPGVPKPFLWQPGAQLVAAAWQVIPKYKILSNTEDFDREIFSYTVQTRLFLAGPGTPVGAGLGSANSRETKYVSRRNIADLANTILKIAKKRSYVDAVINTFALSEIFTQDQEALEVEVTWEDQHSGKSAKPTPTEIEFLNSGKVDELRERFLEAVERAKLPGRQRSDLLKSMFADNGIKNWSGVTSPQIAERIEEWINTMIAPPVN